MKVHITSKFDMEDEKLLYCENHNEYFSLIFIGKHLGCDPIPYAITKIDWFELFKKCMHVKTGPNFNDIVEGKFSERWSENESKREQLFEKIWNNAIRERLVSSKNDIDKQ